jgi:hypothetical protein
MIDQHLGRRSISDFQRGVLALRKREIVAGRSARTAAAASPAAPHEALPTHPSEPTPPALQTREALAKAARLSSNQVVQIEKIQKQGAPELVAAVKAGVVSINAAAAVASLPADEQAAAATAGAQELKEAAKRVRESRRKPPAAEAVAAAPTATAIDGDTVESLRQRVTALEAENQALRGEIDRLRAGALAEPG